MNTRGDYIKLRTAPDAVDRKHTPDTNIQRLHGKKNIMGDSISAHVDPSFLLYASFLSHTMRHVLEAIRLGFQDQTICTTLLERDNVARIQVACI